MKPTFRPALPADLGRIYALNESEVPHVGTITPEKLQRLVSESVLTLVAVDEKETLLGFVLCFDQDSDYESPNFLWFKSRYLKFTYVDRIAVSTHARGKGVGRLFYDEVKRYAHSTQSPIITCEVNLLPPNPTSMRFHTGLGFKEVGTLSSEDTTKKVSMLVWELKKGNPS